MKTYSPKPEHIERRWYVVDASGQVLGRLASEVATLLRGKHKPMYAPHMDTGDHVIVVNADKIELTGNKGEDKYAYRHSGYPGGITAVKYKDLMATRPVAAVEKAVRGMLPKNSLGRQMIKKLHVVPGPEHPHAAQQPVALAVGERPGVGRGCRPPSRRPAAKPARPAKTEAAAAEEPKASTTRRRRRRAPSPRPRRRLPSRRRPPPSRRPTSAKPKATSAAKKTTAKPRPPSQRRTRPPRRIRERGVI